MAHKRKHDAPYEPELPITPMLDMSFQILFFFVMTYHPSALEGQLDLHLPAQPNERGITQPGQLDLPTDVTVVVGTQRDGLNHGGIGQLVVQSLSGEKVAPDLKALGEELK